MSIDFDRERRWWNAKACKEEIDSGDEAVNRALRWRELERRLDGVQTILDVGGGTGAFSVPLAHRGFRVTHLDLSPEMLNLATVLIARSCRKDRERASAPGSSPLPHAMLFERPQGRRHRPGRALRVGLRAPHPSVGRGGRVAPSPGGVDQPAKNPRPPGPLGPLQGRPWDWEA